MTSSRTPQMGFDEKLVEDAELQHLLEQREQAKIRRSQPMKDYTLKDSAVKGYLEKMELKDGDQIRVGPFLVKVADRSETPVEFTAKASRRFNISLPK